MARAVATLIILVAVVMLSIIIDAGTVTKTSALFIAISLYLVNIWSLAILPAIFIAAVIGRAVVPELTAGPIILQAFTNTAVIAASRFLFNRVISGDACLNSFRDLFAFICTSTGVLILANLLINITQPDNHTTIQQLAWNSSMPQIFAIISVTIPLLGLSCRHLQRKALAVASNNPSDFYSLDPIVFNPSYAMLEILGATTFTGIYIACMYMSSTPWTLNQMLPVGIAIIVLIRHGIVSAYTISLSIAVCGVLCPSFSNTPLPAALEHQQISNLTVFCMITILLGRFSSSHRAEKVTLQKRLQSMLNVSIFYIFLVDTDLNIIKLNDTAEKHYQIGQNLDKQIRSKFIVLDENDKPLPPDISPVCQAISSGKHLHNLPLKLQPRNDGYPISMLISCEIIRKSNRNRTGEALLIAVDVTNHNEQLKNQAQLLEQARFSQKKQSLSLLASGVSRNYNTILAIIQGNLDLAQMDRSSPEATQKYLEEARKATSRATELSKQLVMFTGQAGMDIQSRDLNDTISAVVSQLHNELSERISLSLRPSAELPQAMFCQNNIQLVLKNLLENAVDSIGHKTGTIDISTQKMVIDADSLADWQNAVLIPEIGHYAAIHICDSGVGCDASITSQIFDPFFTTKNDSPGLGLAMVFGIIKSHSGAISVNTAPNCGFTITILLPVNQQDA